MNKDSGNLQNAHFCISAQSLDVVYHHLPSLHTLLAASFGSLQAALGFPVGIVTYFTMPMFCEMLSSML
jgi:hypothetical protein